MDIMIKKIHRDARIPEKGSKFAAGYDLFTVESGVVMPHETQMFKTGLQMDIPQGFFGAIFARSGLSIKNGIRPATCVSVIDADYRGEVGIPLHNDSDEEFRVTKGMKVCQMVFLPYADATFSEVDELSKTDRGTGGYGSTGV